MTAIDSRSRTVWRTHVVAATLATATAQALPPPPVQHVADCDAPEYAIDQLVCSDPELSTMDRTVRMMLRAVTPDAVSSPPPFVESQRDWFVRRSRCAFAADGRACTQHAYAERMAVLGALGTGTTPGCTIRCTGALAGLPLGISVNQNVVVLTDPTGRAVLVALEPDAHSPWKAFVEVTVGRRLSFRRVDGQALVGD